MRLRQAFILGILIVGPAGCSTPNGMIQVRNPFDEETEAIRDLLAKNASPDPAQALTSEEINVAPADARYFGRDSVSAPPPKLPSKRDGGEGKVARRSSDSPQAGGASVSATAEASESVSTNRGPKTGAVCYQCNGKGYILRLGANGEGEAQDCPSCGGSGRW